MLPKIISFLFPSPFLSLTALPFHFLPRALRSRLRNCDSRVWGSALFNLFGVVKWRRLGVVYALQCSSLSQCMCYWMWTVWQWWHRKWWLHVPSVLWQHAIRIWKSSIFSVSFKLARLQREDGVLQRQSALTLSQVGGKCKRRHPFRAKMHILRRMHGQYILSL